MSEKFLSNYVGYQLCLTLREKLFNKILRMPLGWFDNNKHTYIFIIYQLIKTKFVQFKQLKTWNIINLFIKYFLMLKFNSLIK